MSQYNVRDKRRIWKCFKYSPTFFQSSVVHFYWAHGKCSLSSLFWQECQTVCSSAAIPRLLQSLVKDNVQKSIHRCSFAYLLSGYLSYCCLLSTLSTSKIPSPRELLWTTDILFLDHHSVISWDGGVGKSRSVSEMVPPHLVPSTISCSKSPKWPFYSIQIFGLNYLRLS